MAPHLIRRASTLGELRFLGDLKLPSSQICQKKRRINNILKSVGRSATNGPSSEGGSSSLAPSPIAGSSSLHPSQVSAPQLPPHSPSAHPEEVEAEAFGQVPSQPTHEEAGAEAEEEVVVVQATCYHTEMAKSGGENASGSKAGAIEKPGAADYNVSGAGLEEYVGIEVQEDAHDSWTPVKTRSKA
ncbi:hypothetical protein RIF29_29488 [Crotalaria pallida]|uniref:Uncharacterized protein n=1 Tax=Crotalaria pallida TaxID=3830 RepID=A0AAN9EGT5_CROPI